MLSLFIELCLGPSDLGSDSGTAAVLEEVPLDFDDRDPATVLPGTDSLDFFRRDFLGISGRSLAGDSEPADASSWIRPCLEPSEESFRWCRLELLDFFGDSGAPFSLEE